MAYSTKNAAEPVRNRNNSSNEFIPLDNIEIEVCSKHGIQTKVSGIHIGFMENRYYVNFRAPPVNSKSEKLSPYEEEWLEYMMFLEEDLHWLLKLPYHRFWSQIVYDENLHRCLESYLSQAPRDYDLPNFNLKEELLAALKKVHRLVFLVYLRMSTYKESKQNHLTPSAFGDLIYDNFIFDIPKLMDLCALYGVQNSAILSKMMQNIFSTQPKYIDDLNESSKMILNAFSSVEEKLIDILSRKSHSTDEDNGKNSESLQYNDTINYVTDISLTLYAFLENYPYSCQIFHQNGAILRLPTFYEQVYSILEKEISRMKESLEKNSAFEDVKQKITLSKTLLVKIFRTILNYAYIQNLLNAKGSKKDEKVSINLLSEGYLEIMLELISCQNFLSDYNLLYPFDEDLVFFNEIGIDLDSEKVNRVFCSLLNDEDSVPSPQSFTSSLSNGARPKVPKSSAKNDHKPVKNLQGLADLLRNKPEDHLNQEDLPSSRKRIIPDLEEMKSLIQSVLDILDGYGEGFIQRCLEHYEYDSEQVVNALLSDSLPDHLNCLDKQLKQVDWNSTNKDTYSVLSERKNVFDNDEFDMFSGKNVNMENVHIGKKNKNPDSYQNLEKDKDSEFLKELTLNYEYEEEDSRVNIYEDEYDDTYDSVLVGLKEPEIDPDEDEEEPPKAVNDFRDKPQDFCINPEILRERAEQRRQAKFNQGRPNRGGGGRGGGGFAGSRTTDDDRHNKDRRKAQVGNHNRRKQADFKRSRGMGPLS